jgi:hypothetical protein
VRTGKVGHDGDIAGHHHGDGFRFEVFRVAPEHAGKIERQRPVGRLLVHPHANAHRIGEVRGRHEIVAARGGVQHRPSELHVGRLEHHLRVLLTEDGVLAGEFLGFGAGQVLR